MIPSTRNVMLYLIVTATSSGSFPPLWYKFCTQIHEGMAVAIPILKGKDRATSVSFKGREMFGYDDRDSRGDGTA